MSESYARDRLVDKVSIARELRGAIQALWFLLATGEEPRVTYGWQTDTCLDQYDELDLVGRVGVRTAPMLVGLALAAFVAHLPLHWPSGIMWLPVGYLGGMWVLLTFYDVLAGCWRVVFRGRTPGVEAAT